MRRLGGDRAGEMRLTRFLRNPSVTPEAMVASAVARLGGRCLGRHVLAIQDTTVVRSSGGGGLYLHPVLAVDARAGVILGLAHAQFLARDAGAKARRRTRPVADKESARWLVGAEAAARACAGADRITVIADRESDIFAAFARRPAGTDLLVRAAQDRSLEDGGRLFARIDACEKAGETVLPLPARPGQPRREARLAVRFMDAALARPRNGPREDLPARVRLTVVDLREVDPPAGAEVHWRLLTTHPVADLDGALAVAALYRRRWAIEQLFRTLKTQGFDIEGLTIEADAPRRNLVMAALIAAVSVQQLVHARDGVAGQDTAGGEPPLLRPLTDAFEDLDQPLIEALCARLEGKTDKQKNPHPRGSLAYAAWVCARMGGWTGYYGKPGPLVILNGWLDLQAAKRGIAALAQATDV